MATALQVLPTDCRLCPNHCPLHAEVEDGRVVRVTGDPDDALYQGFTCVKGRAQAGFLRHPSRLLHSLKRDASGELRPIPVDVAMDEIAAKLSELVERHGSRSVATYWGTMIGSNTVMSSFCDAFAASLGSTMNLNPTTIDKPGKNIARVMLGSWGAPRQAFDEPMVAMLVGLNPMVSFQGAPIGHPLKWIREGRERGMSLIVIDPRRSDVAKRATIHLQCQPGHDAQILAAMLNVILSEGLHDRDFVSQHVTGVDELAAAVRPFDPTTVATDAGLDPDDLVRAARTFAGAGRGYATAGTGPSMSGPGTLVEYLILCLETVCGHFLRAGERVPNPGVLLPAVPARAHVSVPPADGYGMGEPLRVRGLSRCAAGLPISAIADEMLLDGPGRIRALISCAGNPVTAWPDQTRTLAALRSLDLLVQLDPWPSQTARMAHYVIAPKMPLEVTTTSVGLDFMAKGAPAYGSPVPRGRYTPAVAEPPEGSDLIEEWEFFYGVAQRMGVPITLTSVVGSVPIAPAPIDMTTKPTTDEVLQILTRNSRIPLSEVKLHPKGAVFDEPAQYVEPGDPDCPHRLDVGNADMMSDLASVAVGGVGQDLDPMVPPDDLPLRLISRRTMNAQNSNHLWPQTPATHGPNPAYMHPDDMDSLGIIDGDEVDIVSSAGHAVAVAAADPNLLPGLVSMSVGFGEPSENDGDVRRVGTSVNRLLHVDRGYDRYSGQPLMSNIPVRVVPR